MTNARVLRVVLSMSMVAVALALVSQVTFATVLTNAHPVARVTKKIDNNKRTTIRGHVPSALRKSMDLGHLDGKTPATHLVMVLRSSDEQKRELRRVLDEQQDKRTANFHKWVTPEEFGSSFGVHDDDIAQVKAWLSSQGFTVEDVSKSKRVIHFSGTTGKLENAFQTQMHSYQMNGEIHVSNNSEISVPEALSPVIAGVSLHNFFRKGHMGEVSRLKKGPKYGAGGNSATYVGPADFATIYNTVPLLQAGINGTGSSIAVVGRSDILMSDVQSYRQLFNLPVNDPTFVHAGQDNGIEPGDDGESDLDVEISGGVAPNAKVYFVIGTPTFLVDGITNSIEYIVENNLADIMSISYGECEADSGTGGNEFDNQAFEQAAAQGISIFVASGDNGPAQCDDSNDSYEVLGYGTGGEASTPYSVAVGGTQFDDSASADPTYWSSGTNLLYLNSALSYIPEYPWNEAKAANKSLTASGNLSGLWSASGGISAYYLKPSWQQGPGVPTSDPTLTGGQWAASVTITNPGSSYTSAPTVTFSGGGCTQVPQATSTVSGGAVTGVVFNYGAQGGTLHSGQGIGCTSAPTIAFTGGGGTGATATATIGPMQNPLPLITGVPHRYTPDLSLPAAADHEGTLFCSEGVCEISSTGGLQDAGIVGGTSVAAPAMAGVQALINQANGGRQGMPGYIYYALAAAQNTTACNSALPPAPGSNCAFQDITIGDNLVCGTSTCTTSSGTKIGFTAGVGYDMASGLGSPNAANLANQWKNVVFNSSNTTLGLSQTSAIAHGTAITFSGTVAPGAGSGTPTGDVAFIVSQGAFGQTVNVNTGAWNGPGPYATLDGGGNYTASISNLPAGTYNVTARYAGDSTYASSMSAPVQVTVTGGESTTVTITPGWVDGTNCLLNQVSAFSYGQFIWTMVQVAGSSGQGVPTGTVTITLDGNSYTTVSLDPQGIGYLAAGAIPSSSCIYDYNFAQAPTVSGGAHTLGASYSGDGTFAAGTATTVPITVTPISVTPTLAAGGTLISAGTADQLTATFAVSALTGSTSTSSGPTGTVTFTDTFTSTVLGTANVVPSVSFSGNIYTFGGTAVLNTTGITATGANTITASYSGNSNYAATTSSAVTVTVGTGTATTTAVTSNGNPTTLNGRPTFTATVSGGTGPTAGTATFYDGTTVLGTGTVASAHTATFRLASGQAFWGGTHNITAAFGGNSTFMASTSPALVQTVTQGTVTHALTAKTVGTSGQAYTLTDVLTPSQTNATYAPNQGVVTFFDGATNLGSAQPITVTSGQGGYGLWAASISVNSLSVGTHTITASYGDINYATSTSNAQTVYVGNSTVGIYTPVSGTTLSNTGAATFKWYPVPGANFWLDIGSVPGGNSYYQSGNLGTVLSKSVSGLPTDGSTVWARLWTLTNGVWGFTDVSYTAYNVGSNKGVITTPVPGSTLSGTSVTFSWTAGSGATAYWIDAGNVAGGNQYYQSGNLGNVLTKTVSGLPTDGSTVYVTLYSLVSGQWLSNGYTYSAFSAAAAAGVLTTPTPGSTLTSGTVTFGWTAGAGASSYWLDVGSTAGGNQYSQSGNLANVTSTTVSGLPTDGSTIYVTLYSLIGSQWSGNAYTYTAFSATGTLAVIQTPTPGSTLSGNSATFTWSADSSATAYWLDIGNVVGGNQYYQSGNLGNVLTTSVYSLPADGSTIYATLYSYVGGQWLSNSYTYTSGP